MPRHPRSPVDPAARAAVEAELAAPRTPPRSRAHIARDAGVDPRTITRWATELGIPGADAWKTDSIRAATISATDRRRAHRSVIADDLQRRATDLLGKLDGPFLAFSFGGKDNTYAEQLLPEPPTGDIRNLVTSANMLLGRAQDIDERDVRVDDTGGDDVLDRLFTGLAGAYQTITGRPAAAGDDDEEARRA